MAERVAKAGRDEPTEKELESAKLEAEAVREIIEAIQRSYE